MGVDTRECGSLVCLVWKPAPTSQCISHYLLTPLTPATSFISPFVGLPGSSDSKELPAVQKTWIPSLGQEDPQAIHSSILARRIPWIEEPGGLQSMRLQRVGHD